MKEENIKAINDVTGEIIRFEGRVNGLRNRIDRLVTGDTIFDANMALQIGSCKKYTYHVEMTSSEAVTVLQRRLKEDEDTLNNLKKQFQELT